MQVITDAIKFRMNEKDINISELANLTGFSVTYISKLLRGEKRWNETTVSKTLNALGLEIEVVPKKKGDRRGSTTVCSTSH